MITCVQAWVKLSTSACRETLTVSRAVSAAVCPSITKSIIAASSVAVAVPHGRAAATPAGIGSLARNPTVRVGSRADVFGVSRVSLARVPSACPTSVVRRLGGGKSRVAGRGYAQGSASVRRPPSPTRLRLRRRQYPQTGCALACVACLQVSVRRPRACRCELHRRQEGSRHVDRRPARGPDRKLDHVHDEEPRIQLPPHSGREDSLRWNRRHRHVGQSIEHVHRFHPSQCPAPAPSRRRSESEDELPLPPGVSRIFWEAGFPGDSGGSCRRGGRGARGDVSRRASFRPSPPVSRGSG